MTIDKAKQDFRKQFVHPLIVGVGITGSPEYIKVLVLEPMPNLPVKYGGYQVVQKVTDKPKKK